MIRYKGINWFYYQGALLPKVPPHKEIILSKKEERELLQKSKALFLRYTKSWDRDEGRFWYVIKDTFNRFEELSSNTRSKVRRGLKHFVVKQVSNVMIANEGYIVYKEAFKNYVTIKKPLEEKVYKKEILNAKEDDFWAVYYNDRIIAYSQNRIEEESINYAIIKFHPQYLKFYPSYALFYTMNQYYLEEKHFLYVNDGARSIFHETNIQDFLIDKFKFRKSFVTLCIVYRWDIALLIKLLYPLRNFLKKTDLKFLKKITVLLYQEEIRRSYE
jgi:hypothetical protein